MQQNHKSKLIIDKYVYPSPQKTKIYEFKKERKTYN